MLQAMQQDTQGAGSSRCRPGRLSKPSHPRRSSMGSYSRHAAPSWNPVLISKWGRMDTFPRKPPAKIIAQPA